MKVYGWVDMRKYANNYPVYIVVSNKEGRFYLQTGLTTRDQLYDGRVFPSSDKLASKKTTLMCKYLVDVEAICLEQKLLRTSNQKLKNIILKEVFGVDREKKRSLADYVSMFAQTKRKNTAVLYGITERKVRTFDVKATLDIDAKWLERFRLWCLDNGMKLNGASKELRNIRAVFNWARKNGYTNNYPFLGYSIVEEETMPNNLCVEDLRRLRDYPCEDWQEKYVDFFMLSFYLAGMNPVDLLSLKKDSVKDGHVSFVRRKTDKQGAKRIRTIVLPLVEDAKEIIEKYPSNEGYLVNFMDGRKDYHSFMKKCNEALKKIGTQEVVPDRLGKRRKIVYHPLFPKITLYTARYSFGSIAANDLDISEQKIGQCLGHSWSRNVTARYIAHDQRKVDRAIRRVVEYVKDGTI